MSDDTNQKKIWYKSDKRGWTLKLSDYTIRTRDDTSQTGEAGHKQFLAAIRNVIFSDKMHQTKDYK